MSGRSQAKVRRGRLREHRTARVGRIDHDGSPDRVPAGKYFLPVADGDQQRSDRLPDVHAIAGNTSAWRQLIATGGPGDRLNQHERPAGHYHMRDTRSPDDCLTHAVEDLHAWLGQQFDQGRFGPGGQLPRGDAYRAYMPAVHCQ